MVRFLVFGDLHADVYGDAAERLDGIVRSAVEKEVDFIVSLGDLCFPTKENAYILEKLSSAGIPVHHTMGNHDTECCTMEDMLRFLGEDRSYDSFAVGEHKFIVLDSCYFQTSGGEEHFPNTEKKPCNYPVVPKAQVEWLREELADGKKYVLFSHHSLVNDFARRGIHNRLEVRKLFEGRDVLLCMNGHDHGDDLKVMDGIPYYTVNASSGYCWWGETANGFEVKEMPYKDPLHVIVELQGTEVKIRGMESRYLENKPEDVGVGNYVWNGVSILPRTSSYTGKGCAPDGSELPGSKVEGGSGKGRMDKEREISEKFEFRRIEQSETGQAAAIEQICFPPNEACSEKSMTERIAVAQELFFVAVDKGTGKIAGFLNGIATEESRFRDEFFTDAALHDPEGKNVMLLGLDVLPEYRGQGLGRGLVQRYLQRERERGRRTVCLTCLEPKVRMYEKFGFVDLGIANSTWGGETWHEMRYALGEGDAH